MAKAKSARAIETLTLRALSRATLARQLLLARHPLGIVEAIERLAGLQAQVAPPTFIGLWSRLTDFDPRALVTLAEARAVARGTLMRGTLHLVSAADFAAFRPVLGPMLERSLETIIAKRAADLDRDAVLAEARALLATGPRAFDQLRGELAERFPDADDRAPGFLVRMRLPLVQVPDGGTWGWAAKAPFALADQWLGVDVAASDTAASAIEALVLRYLAAFGPASVQDAQAWSGMKGLRAAFDALRTRLVTFHDERGRELFDLPDAPRPDADTAAPVRLLGEFDNLILAHDDRSRVVPPELRAHLTTKNLLVPATVLIDGFVAGTWSWKTTKTRAELTLLPVTAWPKAARTAVTREAEALLACLAPGLAATVTIAPRA